MSTIHWEQGADGVVVLTMDDPGASANTMNAAHLASFAAAVARLHAEKESITGVVLTSAKKTFFAGGNLADLLRVPSGPEAAAASMARTAGIKSPMRDLETLGRPVVAAINGAALGGGLEIALACHHRVVADLPSTRIGFPEVTLGLLPGAGGVVRSVRMLGVLKALTGCLLQGQRLTPAAALGLGLVDEVVPGVADLLPAAKAWIAANPDAAQPWDRPGYRLPGGLPGSAKLSGMIVAAPATLRKQLGGAPTLRHEPSSPLRSRERGSTSRPLTWSRPATSPDCSAARAPRTSSAPCSSTCRPPPAAPSSSRPPTRRRSARSWCWAPG